MVLIEGFPLYCCVIMFVFLVHVVVQQKLENHNLCMPFSVYAGHPQVVLKLHLFIDMCTAGSVRI